MRDWVRFMMEEVRRKEREAAAARDERDRRADRKDRVEGHDSKRPSAPKHADD